MLIETLRNTSFQDPEIEPGDIVIVLDEKEHPVYKRNGSDLAIEMNVKLVEALCGFEKLITTLDNRTLIVQSFIGDIIKPSLYFFILSGITYHLSHPTLALFLWQSNSKWKCLFSPSLTTEVSHSMLTDTNVLLQEM